MRPMLIGMNNPLSLRPGHELFPHPPGCTGWRIWQMLHSRTGALKHQYLDAFERRNLVRGEEYDRAQARRAARAIVDEVWDTGRTIVLLGTAVREAFNHALCERSTSDWAETLPPVFVHPVRAGGCTWRQIPHPSGRNLFYNDPKNREVVAMLLQELYEAGRK